VPAGPAGITHDNTPESGAPGIILGFVGGRFAKPFRARNPADRKRAFVAELAAALGDEARGDSDYFDMDWTAEPYTRGVPDRLNRARRAQPLRRADPAADRPDPLGRHRDRRLLGRLHGRRGPVRRTGREGGRPGSVIAPIAGFF
jgi:monoamine oxidase